MADNGFQPYPGWRFHPTLPAKTVASKEEDEALGDGWYDPAHPPIAGSGPGEVAGKPADPDPDPAPAPKPRKK